jgi:hypothetical protein
MSGNPGVQNIIFTVNYDRTKLTLLDYNMAPEWAGKLAIPAKLAAAQIQSGAPFRIAIEAFDLSADVTGNGNLVVMSFAVNSGASSDIQISLGDFDITNFDLAQFGTTTTGVSGGVEVKPSTTPNSIVLSKPSGKPGNEVDVVASFLGDSSIAGFDLEIGYNPDILTPVSVTRDSSLGGSTSFEGNLSYETNKIRVVWANASDVTTEKLFTIRFKISGSAGAGVTPVTVTPVKVAKASPIGLITVSKQDGYVTVIEDTGKLPGALITKAAVELSTTQNSITVIAAEAPGTQSIEYHISPDGSNPPSSNSSGWLVDNLTFSGLSPSTTYYVWARTAENNDYYAGVPEPSIGITTKTSTGGGDGGRQPGADITTPAAEASKTPSSITVTVAQAIPNPGYQSIEYLINTNGSNHTLGDPSPWQSGLTFTGLTPGTTYYVWARTVQNGGYYAGTPNVSLAITTPQPPIVIPGDANKDGKVDLEDLRLILQYIVGLKSAADIDLYAADIYKDGSVDLLDAVLLAQHLADPFNVTIPMTP